jgi:hypothetical protein
MPSYRTQAQLCFHPCRPYRLSRQEACCRPGAAGRSQYRRADPLPPCHGSRLEQKRLGWILPVAAVGVGAHGRVASRLTVRCRRMRRSGRRGRLWGEERGHWREPNQSWGAITGAEAEAKINRRGRILSRKMRIGKESKWRKDRRPEAGMESEVETRRDRNSEEGAENQARTAATPSVLAIKC